MKNKIFIYFLDCKGLWNDDVGGARGTRFQQIRPGAGFATNRRFRERNVGGATVERGRKGGGAEGGASCPRD